MFDFCKFSLEDDMKVPSKEKEKPLCEFYTHIGDEDWVLPGCKCAFSYVQTL